MAVLTASGELLSYSGIVCLVLAYIFVGLRLLVRVLRKQHLYGHDFMILASLAVFTAYCAVQWSAVYNSLGTIDFTVLLSDPEVFIPVVKIFPDKSFRRAVYIVMGITCAWLVSWTVALSLRCTPVRATWDALAIFAGARCRDLAPDLSAYEATNIFVDILILALPINRVYKLQMPKKKKIGIVVTFAVGGFVVVTSAVKIYYCNVPTTQIGAKTTAVDVPKVFAWSTYEQCSSIICACLPTLRYLARSSVRSKPSYDAGASSGKKRFRNDFSDNSRSSANRGQYEDLEAGVDDGRTRLGNASSEHAMVPMSSPSRMPENVIHVRHDFAVSSPQIQASRGDK